MKGFVKDIEALATGNGQFRQVLYTAKHCQLVLMALKPKEEIGAEVHKLDQFFRVEEGSGEAVLDGVRTADPSGLRCPRPRWDEPQHHQYRQRSNEALYALCAAKSPGWRCPPYPRRRRSRQRALRWKNHRIERPLPAGRLQFRRSSQQGGRPIRNAIRAIARARSASSYPPRP